MAVIGPDLQSAIEQLRAVPLLNVWSSRPTNQISSFQQTASSTPRRQEETATVETTRHSQTTYNIDDIVTSDSDANDVNNDVCIFETSQCDDVTGSDSSADDSADGRSKYTMSWNIRKMHQHRLDPVEFKRTDNSKMTEVHVSRYQTGLSSREQKISSLSSTSCDMDSSESIDSVVERILETTDNASGETKHRQSASKSGTEASGRGKTGDEPSCRDVVDTVNVTLDVNRRHFVVYCDERRKADEEHGQDQKCAQSRAADNRSSGGAMKSEATLEDLFEQAVESLDNANYDEDDDVSNRSTAAPPSLRKQYRGEENVERRIYDDDLHQQCHEYRLHGYSFVQDEQCSRVSRGFALVEKVDKSTASLKRRTEDRTDCDVTEKTNISTGQTVDQSITSEPVAEPTETCSKSASETESKTTYRQRTVISASLAPSVGHLRRNDEDCSEDYVRKLDLGLDSEMAVNAVSASGQHSAGMSRSSSITWDTISVDSLVMVNDDSTTLRAVYSATTSTTPRQDRTVDDVSTEDENNGKMTPTNDTEPNLSEERRTVNNNTICPNDPHSSICVTGQSVTQMNERKHQRNSGDTVTVSSVADQANSVNIQSRDDSATVTAVTLSSYGTSSSPVNIHQSGSDVKILADSLTTQTLVLNVKLPKAVWSKSNARSKSAPSSCRRSLGGVPYRELRVHREIRLSDIEQTNSNGGRHATSGVGQLASLSAVESNDQQQTNNNAPSDDVTTSAATSDNTVIVFTSLRPSDVMTSLPFETEVESENRRMTSGTELLPYSGATDTDVPLVGVEQTDTVRELIVKGRHSSDFRYEPASLRLLVDNVKEALTVGGKVTSLGGIFGMTCKAVESRSVNSHNTPTTVINDTLVDCLTV